MYKKHVSTLFVWNTVYICTEKLPLLTINTSLCKFVKMRKVGMQSKSFRFIFIRGWL